MRFTDQTTPAPRREAALLLLPLVLSAAASAAMASELANSPGAMMLAAMAPSLMAADLTTSQAADTAAATVMPIVRVSATPLPEESTEDTGAYAVSATRGATGMLLTPRETPQSVSVMTHARIQDQQLNDITAVVTQMPGISAQPEDTERVSFYARGFVIDNVLYDGVRTYPGAYSNDGKTQSDMAVFDRVEVIRGATGLMSGTGNPGASVDMIRKRPTAAFQGSVSASAGTWNRYRADVDLSGPLNAAGTLRGRVVGAESDGDSFVDLYHKRREVGYGVFEYDLAPRTLLTVGIDRQSNRARGVTWGCLPALFSDGTPTSFVRSTSTATRDSDWNEDTRNLFASVETHLDSGWTVKSSFNQFNSSYDARLSAWGGWAVRGIYPDRLTGAGALQFPGQFDESNVTRTLDLRASGSFSLGGRRHQAVVGLSGTRMSNAGDVYSPAAYPALSSSIYAWDHDDPIPAMHLSEHYTGVNVDTGAFGAVRLRPTDALSVIMGARVTSYSRQQGNTNPNPVQFAIYDYRKRGVVTPYAGVVLDLDRTYSAYASYTGIYAPQNATDASGNLLKPVEGKAWEGGLKAAWLDSLLNGSLALFKVDQDNVAQAAGVIGTSTYYRAAPGVRSRGFEAELQGALSNRWNISGGFTRQLAADAGGQRINPDRPQNLLRLFSTYQMPGAWSRLKIGGGIKVDGATFSNIATPAGLVAGGAAATTRFVQGGYTLASLTAHYDFSRQLSAALAINNLFDKTYYSGTSFYSDVIYGDPRNVMLNLRWRF